MKKIYYETRTGILVLLFVVCFACSAAATDLEITPVEDFEPSGISGGPFTPSSKDYQLRNSGSYSLFWSAAKAVNWLALNSTFGLLEPNETTIVTVSLTSEANSLPEGVYTDTLTFVNLTAFELQTRGVILSVGWIWVSPTSFDVNVVEGCTLIDTLTIGNHGPVDLDFMIGTRVVSSPNESSELRVSKAAEREAGIFSVPKGHDFMVVADAPYKPGELIARFAAKADGKHHTKVEKNQILSSLGGGAIKRDFKIVPGLSVVKLPAGMTVKNALRTFNKAEGILYAEPNYRVKVLSSIPNDPRFCELWGMHNTGQTGGTPDADIDAPEAWDIANGSHEIVVAVIDSGVDYTHADLAPNIWVNEAEANGTPGVDDDGNGYEDDIYGYDFCNDDPDPMDDHDHGTHCAGTIGAVGNNGEGVTGVCWNVRIMALKFLDSDGGNTADAIECVEYSTLMGANLSSNSWGGGGYSQGLKDAIEAAGAAGMLFVAAAGNDGQNNDTIPLYPSSYVCSNIIAVMATDHDDERSIWSPYSSNYGLTSVDLGAPGTDILSCEPGGGYQYMDGTSMAAPHVAGACALIWSMNPMLSNSEVKDILLGTVDPVLSGLCVSEGRLNLYNAVLETKTPWIEIEPEEGTIGSGDSNDISVTFDAVGMTPAAYQTEIVIFPTDPCRVERTVPVKMTVTSDDLAVAPAEGSESSGPEGGPFEPRCMSYTLTNNGIAPVSWTTFEIEDWLEVDPNEGVLDPNESVDVSVCVSPNANLLDPNTYAEILTFQNIDSNSVKQRLVTLTVRPPDSFTEFFESGTDLNLLSLTLSPDGSAAYYEACQQRVTGFPTDPNGGTYVPLDDDDFVEVALSGGAEILFFGQWYDRFYIGSNGYITFGQGDTQYMALLVNHFNIPRISALFTDLNPANNECISYKQLEDRVAVTFEDVPLYADTEAKSTFQIEMFFVDGTLRITWLDLAQTVAVVGLSQGNGGCPPIYFAESDLRNYALGDFDGQCDVDFGDFAILALAWLSEEGDPEYDPAYDISIPADGVIDWRDLDVLADNWLAGK